MNSVKWRQSVYHCSAHPERMCRGNSVYLRRSGRFWTSGAQILLESAMKTLQSVRVSPEMLVGIKTDNVISNTRHASFLRIVLDVSYWESGAGVINQVWQLNRPWSSAWIEKIVEQYYWISEVLSNSCFKAEKCAPNFFGVLSVPYIFQSAFRWIHEKFYCPQTPSIIWIKKCFSTVAWL
jgi:hypothetical protein